MGEGGQENGCREAIEILALVWRESEENRDKAGLRWYWCTVASPLLQHSRDISSKKQRFALPLSHPDSKARLTSTPKSVVRAWRNRGNLARCIFTLRKLHFDKDCIGAIDGTHISAWVPTDRQTSFRGTANDARVFLDALTRPEVNFPWPSEGNYYVVDSGYPCIFGFLPPYREYEIEDLSIEGEEEITSSRNHSIDLSDESAAAMAACRDQIAEVMQANYINVNL
ncbi:hypothetical protein CK203_116383 [Vitis vinifera]|uniref:DDE Tnp4 domain-containing protein n=1 Tax=Vitis vinifera TaxID=29760 RepID=A0A438DBU2_VITVI|nr:hypothetical protein CK203_116383 [Vitis vinifera]